MTGTFGRLTVLRQDIRERRSTQAHWVCECSCGTLCIVAGNELRSGHTQSCGCLHLEVTSSRGTHRKTGTKSYQAWSRMRRRCSDTTDKHFKDYGGRGITVCDRWSNFENFDADMGDPPSALHSLDRKNTNGNYEPDNCRWATAEEQANNRRNVKLFEVDGILQSVAQLSRSSGIPYLSLKKRIKYGWPLLEALSTPINGRRTTL